MIARGVVILLGVVAGLPSSVAAQDQEKVTVQIVHNRPQEYTDVIGKEAAITKHLQPISPDGKWTLRWVAGKEVGDKQGFWVVDAKTGKETTFLPYGSKSQRNRYQWPVWAFAADGPWVATAVSSGNQTDGEGHVRVWNIDTGRVHREIDAIKNDVAWVYMLQFARPSHLVVYCQQLSGR